jgi:hypothetical protein
VRTYEDQSSVAHAYNDAFSKAAPGAEFSILVHQDMYFPEGWLNRLQEDIRFLSGQDPSWAVLGCFGVTRTGEEFGHLYSNGHGVIGRPFGRPIKVRTLDEIVLVVRHISGLHFTQTHCGFHLYGADICLRAEQLGLNCYAIDNFCVHNTRDLTVLPSGFYERYQAIVRNFPAALPVATTCTQVASSGWPFRYRLFRDRIRKLRGSVRVVERLPDPTTVL